MTYYEIMQKPGKRIHPKLYYYDSANTKVEIDRDNIESIKLSYNAPLTGSVMIGLVATLKVKLPDTAIYFQNTAIYNGTNATKTYGPFYLKEDPSFSASDKTYEYVMYDIFLKAMVDYKPIAINYPCTVLDFFKQLCLECGCTTDITSLPNGSRTISMDIYEGINYTYRDVFDDIANATASLFCIKNNVVQKCVLGTSAITINDDLLKNQNIELGERFGPINSIVLSRSGESDSIYKRDETLTSWNEYKIVDNQLMNDNNRSDYLDELYNALCGIEYDIFDLELVGYGGFDPLTKVTITTNNTTYNSYVFNNELTFTQGVEECIYTEMPEQSETDYKKSDTTDKRINQIYIITDKQNKKIEALTTEVTENSKKTAQLEISVENISQEVSEIADLTKEVTQIGELIIEDAILGDLLKFSITGNMSLLYPSDDLYPSGDLYPLDSYLIIEDEDGNQNKIHLPLSYLNYLNATIYDEFVIEDGQAKIIRRVGENDEGVLYALSNPIEEDLGELNIPIVTGYNKIWLESFYDLSLKYYAEYACENKYTDTFATKVELNSSIKQTKDEINLEVSKKVDENEVVSTINQSAEQITLTGNRLVVNATNFSLTAEGKATMNDAVINGGELHLQNGAKVTGDNGLITNLMFRSDGNYGSYSVLGYGSYYEVGGAPTSFKNNLYLDIDIPSNFTIESAILTLFVTSAKWSNSSGSGYTNGSPRNLKVYRILDGKTYVVNNTQNIMTINENDLTEISGALGVTSYTPNCSEGYVTSKVGTDIKSSLKSGHNILVIQTADNLPSPTNSDTINNNTGMGMVLINIMGYMNFET